MAINVQCSECGKAYALRDEMAGKKAKCKECGAVIDIPLLEEAPQAADAYEITEPEQGAPGAEASQMQQGPLPMGRPVAPAGPPETCGYATASLVLGIVSFVCGGLVTAILAIVFGKSAQRKIEESRGALTGEGLAKAGIILGWVNIAVVLVFTTLWIIFIVLVGVAQQ